MYEKEEYTSYVSINIYSSIAGLLLLLLLLLLNLLLLRIRLLLLRIRIVLTSKWYLLLPLIKVIEIIWIILSSWSKLMWIISVSFSLIRHKVSTCLVIRHFVTIALHQKELIVFDFHRCRHTSKNLEMLLIRK